MDGLEADVQQFRNELNDVWGQIEADAEAYDYFFALNGAFCGWPGREAYDYLDECLIQLENKTIPSLRESGPQDKSRPPQLDRLGPVRQQPARERNGPWYEDRRSERSERSETRGRAWYDRPADRHRSSSRDSLRSVRYGGYNRTERRSDPLEGLPEPPGWWKSGPYGPLPGVFGVHGDIRWFQIAPFFSRRLLHSWKGISHSRTAKKGYHTAGSASTTQSPYMGQLLKTGLFSLFSALLVPFATFHRNGHPQNIHKNGIIHEK